MGLAQWAKGMKTRAKLGQTCPSPLPEPGEEMSSTLCCSTFSFTLLGVGRNDVLVGNLRRNGLCLVQLRSSALLFGSQPDHRQRTFSAPLTVSYFGLAALVRKACGALASVLE